MHLIVPDSHQHRTTYHVPELEMTILFHYPKSQRTSATNLERKNLFLTKTLCSAFETATTVVDNSKLLQNKRQTNHLIHPLQLQFNSD